MFRYVVKAIDNGSPKRTGTTTVNVIYQDDTTTSTTTAATTTAYNFWDHGENIAMFVMTLLAGLALLGALLYCCLRFCCGGSGAGCGNMCECMNHGRRSRFRYENAMEVRTILQYLKNHLGCLISWYHYAWSHTCCLLSTLNEIALRPATFRSALSFLYTGYIPTHCNLHSYVHVWFL